MFAAVPSSGEVHSAALAQGQWVFVDRHGRNLRTRREAAALTSVPSRSWSVDSSELHPVTILFRCGAGVAAKAGQARSAYRFEA